MLCQFVKLVPSHLGSLRLVYHCGGWWDDVVKVSSLPLLLSELAGVHVKQEASIDSLFLTI